MNIKDLVGYQLVSINDNEIVVKKGTSVHTLRINYWGGDCCGYNEIDTKLFISEDELARNPIITNVDIDGSGCGYSDSAKITFFGEVKALAELNSLSSSESGWQYGACVTIICDSLNLEEVITEW